MSNQRRYYQPKFGREIRFGLVVYGGISLAIYMYGICQEFYHAVRGRGVYKLVKALTDADLVVDVISGSSAGGVNGILLSYALANSNDRELVDFNSFASIWRNNGDLLRALHEPNLFKDRSSESGFHDDGFYQRELVAALGKASEHKLVRSPQEWFSDNQELDLFIAGTDYLGRVKRRLNATGMSIESKDHHVLFHLKHRQGRKEPFNPHLRDGDLPRTAFDTQQALAKLCCITAGFPSLFPLVEIDLQDRRNLVDRQLVVWGKLDRHSSSGLSPEREQKLYFLDGGLLDNTPFSCIMKETYYRLPTRRGDRQLFYVDSDVSLMSIDPLDMLGRKKPPTGQMLKAAVLSIPSHQSIANDLRTIEEHNHKVRRYQLSIEQAAIAVESQKRSKIEDRTQSQIYLRGRLFDFRDRNLPLLLQSEITAHNSHYSTIVDKIETIISNEQTNSQERHHYQNIMNRFESQVVDLDVEYSIRNHFYIIQIVNDFIGMVRDAPTRQKLEHLSQQIRCNIKLLEIIRESINLLLQDRTVSNYFYYLVNQESNTRRLHALVYEMIFRLHRFLLDGTKLQTFIPDRLSGSKLETIPVYFWLDLPELATQNNNDRWLSQTRISSVFAQLKQRITDLQQTTDISRLIWRDISLKYDEKQNETFPSILKQIDLVGKIFIERSANQYTDKLLEYWNKFSCLDRELYPFEYLTNLKEKQFIRPISINPNLAQFGHGNGKNADDKLANNRFYNIGGFFKKSWKSNDLLWGRFDGLNRIIEGTITTESVTKFSEFVRRESNLKNCSQSEYIEWLITESLPYISGKRREKIREHLNYLNQPKLRIDRAELRTILEDLVLAGQDEILQNYVSLIYEDIDDRPGWWRVPGSTQSSSENWILNKINLQPSFPVSNAKAIGSIVKQSLTNLAIEQQNFFHRQYRIGVDKLWENMPLVTLISLCTKIVLMLRNILVRLSSRSIQNQTMRHPLYHWLDGILQSIYWWLQGGTIRLGSVHRRPRIIALQLLGAITAISGVVFAFLVSPFWLLFSLPGAFVCWFLQTMRLKRLTATKHSPFLAPVREK